MDSLAPYPQRFALSPSEKHSRLLLQAAGLSARQSWRLIQCFQQAEAVCQATVSELMQVLSQARAEQLVGFLRQNAADQLWQDLAQEQIQVCFFEEPQYPEVLRSLYDPPLLLYWKGCNLWSHLAHGVGVIGTRRPTPYGLRQTERLVQYLVAQQQCVVSGMALGIDAAAHRACLAAHGNTVAVLGSGLLKPSPRTHLRLFRQLCEQGMVISEFPPEMAAQTWTFPMRNRIVSGLSAALVVIEAARKSGTLITVDCAIEQGREVFALPGPVESPQSEGTHALIQQGAHLLACPENIAEVMNWADLGAVQPANSPVNGLTNTQQAVYEVLSESPQNVENIVIKSGYPLSVVLGILTELEIKGLVAGLPGKLYRRSFPSFHH